MKNAHMMLCDPSNQIFMKAMSYKIVLCVKLCYDLFYLKTIYTEDHFLNDIHCISLICIIILHVTSTNIFKTRYMP